MNQETNVQEKEARVRQPWTAQRVGDILLNNALLIIMAIAVVYIAIKNPNFIKPASLINILSQTAAYLPAALGIGGCIVLTLVPTCPQAVPWVSPPVSLHLCCRTQLTWPTRCGRRSVLCPFPWSLCLPCSSARQSAAQRLLRGKIQAASFHRDSGHTADPLHRTAFVCPAGQ